MNEGLQIVVGPLDEFTGNRSVTATLNGHRHVDCFNTNTASKRRHFRETVVRKFGLPEGDAHEFIEDQIFLRAERADEAPATLDTPNVVRASDVEAKPIEWLDPNLLPAGALVMADGDPGTGKSQVTCSFAAAVSSGKAFPNEPPFIQRDPRGALMLGCEDDAERTTRPRLDAAGADVSRVHLLTTLKTPDGSERLPSLPGDVPMLEKLVVDLDVALLTIDPVVAYLDPKLSMNCDADVRRALGPLAAMAQRTGVCVLLVRHLNKKGNGPALYRGGGSIGLVGACRAAFIVAASPDDPDLRVFAPTKFNLGPRPDSLLFRIEPFETTSRVVWCGTTQQTADELMSDGKDSGGSKVDKAVAIIEDALADGARGENEVRGLCEEAGISRGTYWTARKKLKVVSQKDGYSGGWIISLPAPVEEFNHHEYGEEFNEEFNH